jgi:sec-independent protein translocase protein TatB
MEVFNIGTGELLFILLLAILVVGPKRTVELAQQAGRFLGRLQREWDAVRRGVVEEITTLEKEVTGEPKADEEAPPQQGEDRAG